MTREGERPGRGARSTYVTSTHYRERGRTVVLHERNLVDIKRRRVYGYTSLDLVELLGLETEGQLKGRIERDQFDPTDLRSVFLYLMELNSREEAATYDVRAGGRRRMFELRFDPVEG